MSSLYQVLEFEVPTEAVDLATGLLSDFDLQGLEEKTQIASTVLRAAFPEDASRTEIEAVLKPHFSGLMRWEVIDLRDIRFQPPTFEPIEIIKNFWICPPDDMPTETQAGAGEKIYIRPSTGFGTGRHESTQLCAELLSELPKPKTLLDLGSGSGILAILAAKLGIPKVAACENDIMAVENAQENFELNSVSIPMELDFFNIQESFDVILANILSSTHFALKDQMIKCLKPNGMLVLSGILIPESAEIEKEFSQLKLLKRKTKNIWVAYAFQK